MIRVLTDGEAFRKPVREDDSQAWRHRGGTGAKILGIPSSVVVFERRKSQVLVYVEDTEQWKRFTEHVAQEIVPSSVRRFGKVMLEVKLQVRNPK